MVDPAKFREAVRRAKREREAVTDNNAKLIIGQRLASEASRLSLTTTKASRYADCSRRTWAYYEAGITTPDAATLQRLDAVGFDILYVITGRTGRRRKTAEPRTSSHRGKIESR